MSDTTEITMEEPGAGAGAKSDGGGQFVSLVLPVYNERGNLKELYAKICEVIDDRSERYELLFVDDGSSDGSFEILEELQAEDERIRAVQFRRNFGKAAAYSAGFRHARGDVIVTMDTDLQDHPDEIPQFLDKINEGFDMVIGWKFEGKGDIEKRLPSKFFNRVVSKVTGVGLHDFNCPFKAYRREVLQEIEVYGELHRYIPVLANAKGFTMTEVPIKNLPRGYGVSKYGIERYIRGMLDLLTVIFITRFSQRPLHLLGLGGIMACTFGAAIVAFFILAHFMYVAGILTDSGWNIHDRPALSLGILLLIVGTQFFSIGLLGELFITERKGPDYNDGYSVRRIVQKD